jgi:RTC4-like domain
MEHIIFELRSDFPRRMLKDLLLRMVRVGTYIITVLVPELAVILIKEDIKVDNDKTARQILQKSTGLGETLHEDV